ncbi:hypothetical protein UUU_27200 [Klebsiella pneumoniae subsp. pneumoniae DSM 30104 = JCM 1662 = NBRC 14940]|nr:hypothetical protein UUU_27200 [Klebsiella pneumoniae subsp. pneumoniae DSM 30104 = JCM 1662 = NBRC 14940]
MASDSICGLNTPKKWVLAQKHNKKEIFTTCLTESLTPRGSFSPRLMVRKLKKRRLSFLTMNN